MHKLSYLPDQVRYVLRGSRQFFRYRHHLVFCWSLVLLLICQDKATLSGLARLGPKHICAWHLRRFLCAGYWSAHLLLWYMADALISVLPPPTDGVLYVIGDGTYKGKTAKKHPFCKKGRIRRGSPYLFGIQIIIVMLHWDSYRIPIDFEIVHKKDTKGYSKPNALFRAMLGRLKKPAWTKKTIVVADAEFAAKETLQQIKDQGDFFLMAMARTWKFTDDRALRDLVQHLPKYRYKRTWIKRADGKRRVFWIYSKPARLRHIGDVTLVLSKKRRNDGPKSAIILVTNLQGVTARHIVMIYAKRWHVELLIKEVKGVCGLAQAQLTKEQGRVERSVALSFMAYLLLIICQRQDIPQQGPWSAFALKQAFIWQTAHDQLEHDFLLRSRMQPKLKVSA